MTTYELSVGELETWAAKPGRDIGALRETNKQAYDEIIQWTDCPDWRQRRIAHEVERRINPPTTSARGGVEDEIRAGVAKRKAGANRPATLGEITPEFADAMYRALFRRIATPIMKAAGHGTKTLIAESEQKLTGKFADPQRMTEMESKLSERCRELEARCALTEGHLARMDRRFDASRRHLRNVEARLRGERPEREDGSKA